MMDGYPVLERTRPNYIANFWTDWREMSPPAAVRRALRTTRALMMGHNPERLLRNPAFREHVRRIAPNDPLPFLSHRYYLARGLSVQQRIAAALHHYEHEVSAYDRSYFESVYQRDGLVLWRAETNEGTFDIRLQSGNDVLYEGGISAVAHFNGGRICVMSYSVLPTAMILPGETETGRQSASSASILFITRKHLTTEFAYQKAFNEAFDRSTISHFCFAAVGGVAAALGHHQVAAIVPRVHPSCTPEQARYFEVAYSDFWQSLSGRERSPYGFVIGLPMQMTPLDQMTAKARKRAIARRRHIERVFIASRDTLTRHLW